MGSGARSARLPGSQRPPSLLLACERGFPAGGRRTSEVCTNRCAIGAGLRGALRRRLRPAERPRRRVAQARTLGNRRAGVELAERRDRVVLAKTVERHALCLPDRGESEPAPGFRLAASRSSRWPRCERARARRGSRRGPLPPPRRRRLAHHRAGRRVGGVPAWYAIDLTVTMVAFLLWRARRVTRAATVLGECARPVTGGVSSRDVDRRTIGFLVADARGRLVGRVQSPMYGTRPDEPDALAVRSGRFWRSTSSSRGGDRGDRRAHAEDRAAARPTAAAALPLTAQRCAARKRSKIARVAALPSSRTPWSAVSRTSSVLSCTVVAS